MPTPGQIHQQMQRLTTDLVSLSLCDQQNFPVLIDRGSGVCELSTGEHGGIVSSLKNVPYQDIYNEMDRKRTFNLRMLDGALVHVMYRFRHRRLETHRLAFFPSPFLEDFQNNPDIYLEDEIYTEVVMKSIVPFPLRFDFDNTYDSDTDVDHPKSHLTLGQYKNCRIPVSAPLTPYNFIGFILRNFYNTAYKMYSNRITSFSHRFDVTITSYEKELLYVQIPTELTKK